MTLVEDCRHWSAEMHRSASIIESEGVDTPALLQVVDGNRAIADTLAAAAERIEKLEALAKSLEPLRQDIAEAGETDAQWEAVDGAIVALAAAPRQAPPAAGGGS